MKTLSIITRTKSTEYGIFEDRARLSGGVIEHVPTELNARLLPKEQGEFRFAALMEALQAADESLEDIQMVIVPGGIESLPPGVYMVTDDLLELVSESRIDEGVARSAAFLAVKFADHVKNSCDAECIPLFLEPAVDNEIIQEAVLSGMKGSSRNPVYHALSQRAAVSLYAFDSGLDYLEVSAIVAYLGNEISVGAYERGRIIDSNSPLDGEGPMSPTTSGTLPVDSLIRLCYAGKYDMDEMLDLVNRSGGLAAHLGKSKLADVREACGNGDQKAIFYVRAMAYQTAREIGAKAAALYGMAEAVILTGPWAAFQLFTDEIISRVKWIAPVHIKIWESDLTMMAIAAFETYNGNNKILVYKYDRQRHLR